MSNPVVTIDLTPASLAQLVAAAIVDERRTTVIAASSPAGSFRGWGPKLPR